MAACRIFRSMKVFIAVLVMTACGLGQGPRQAQAEEMKLSLVLPLTAIYALPYFAADDWGIFKEEGLSIEYKVVNGDQNAMRAMISGSADVAIGVGPPVLFELVGQGAEVRAIDLPMRITDYFMVMGKGKGDTLKDLAGKRIAISTPGSMPHLLPQMILKKNGIDPAGMIFIAIGSMSARLQAIIAGKVDASIVDTQATLVGGNDIVIITSVPEQFPEGLAYGYTVVSASSLKNPSTRKALVALNRGVMRAVKGIYADPDKAAEVMYERVQHSLDLNLLKQIVRRLNSLKIWGEGLGVEAGVYDFTLKTYLEANTISKSVPYSSAVDRTVEADAVQAAK